MSPVEVKILAAMGDLIGTTSRHHVTTSRQLNLERLSYCEAASQRAAATAGKKWLSDLGPSTVVAALADVVGQRTGDEAPGRPEQDEPADSKIQAAVAKLVGADSTYSKAVVRKLKEDLRKTRETAALRAGIAAEKKWLSALSPRVVVAALAKVTKRRASQQTPSPAGQDNQPEVNQ